MFQGQEAIKCVFTIGRWIGRMSAESAVGVPEVLDEVQARLAPHLMQLLQQTEGVQGGGG